MRPATTVMCLLSAGLTPEVASGGGPTYIDPTSFGVVAGVTLTAKGDAVWGITDCSMAAGSNVVTCANELFQPGDVGKTFIIDDAGSDPASGGRAPLVGTISTVGAIASHSATLSAPATNQVAPNLHIADVDVASPGTNFTFGSNQSIGCNVGSGNTCTTSMGSLAIAAGTPAILTLVNAVKVAAGTGGTANGSPNGTCTVTGNTETSLPGQSPSITVSLSAGGIASVISIASGGNIVAEGTAPTGMTGTYTEGVSGCGSLSGGTLALSYGVVLEQIVPRHGYYTMLPCSSMGTAVMTSVGAPGSGLTVTCADTFTSAAAWGTDNLASFQEAIRQSNVAASGGTLASATGVGPRCVYLPEGSYLTSPLRTSSLFGTLDTMMGYGCWLGDERYHSIIFVVPDISGDLFSWLDSGFARSLPTLGYTQYISNFSVPVGFNKAGSAVRNLTVIGDRSSNAVQNALMFYGPTNYTLVDDVVVSYLRGRALGAGMPDGMSGAGRGDFTESRVLNARFDYDGDLPSGTTQTPTVDIFAQSIEGSNNIDFSDFRIFQPFGPGIWLHQSNSVSYSITQDNRQLRLTNTKIEGSNIEKIQGAGGDLIEFGDPGPLSSGKNVDSILCRNLQLTNPPLGYAALHVAGDTQADTSAIDCQGSIQGQLAGGDGRGIQLDTCAGCSFEEIENTSSDYNLLVGTLSATGPASAGSCSFTSTSTAPTSTMLAYDGAGLEAKLSACITPLATGLVSLPARQLLAAGNVGNTGLLAPVAPVQSLITSPTGMALAVTKKPLGSTTVSAATLAVNAAAPSWIALRQGPTAPFTDTLPAASTIIGTLVSASSGEQHQITLCNQTSVQETLVGNTGIVLSGVSVVTPNSCVALAIVINAISPAAITVTGG